MIERLKDAERQKCPMNISKKSAISTTYFAVVIIVLIVIAGAGWGLYATASGATTTTTQTQTITQTQTGSQTGAQTVTQTVTETATQTSGQATVYGQPAVSSVPFTITTFAGTPVFADYYTVQDPAIAGEYIPGATFTPFSNAGQITQALAADQVQMAVLDPTAVIPAIIAGAPIQLVASTNQMPMQWTVVVEANSSYHSLADLHGGTFAASSLTTTTAYLTEYLLYQKFGWHLNTDYSMAGVGSLAAELAALSSGSISALLQDAPVTYSGMVSHQLRSVYNFTGLYPSDDIFANSAFVQQHPDAVRATVYAFLQANRLWNSNETASVAFIANNFGETTAHAQFDYGILKFSVDGAVSITGVQQAINLLYFAGAINQNISSTSFISSDFASLYY